MQKTPILQQLLFYLQSTSFISKIGKRKKTIERMGLWIQM